MIRDSEAWFSHNFAKKIAGSARPNFFFIFNDKRIRQIEVSIKYMN